VHDDGRRAGSPPGTIVIAGAPAERHARKSRSTPAARLPPERLKSPLERREVRLRGLHV